MAGLNPPNDALSSVDLRVLGILLVASFSTIRALVADNTVGSALGILGAIAGYLFGATTDKSDDPTKPVGGA